MANLDNQQSRQIRTDNIMINIYDKYIEDYEKKEGVRLSYRNATKKIAMKILAVGGLKV